MSDFNKIQSNKEQKEEKKPGIAKKVLKWLFVFLIVLVVGGAGGVFADRFLFPYLATNAFFEKYECFKPKETKIIVQEKETVKIEESEVINDAISKVKPSVVAIVKEKESDNLQHYGSGFVVTSDGLIVTNSEVVDNNKDKYVVFTKDKNYEAKSIHIDSASSLIFLKVEADNLPVVSMGVSDDLRLGQKIISLGYNALDFQDYATSGIISSLNSSIYNNNISEKLNQMIFTDGVTNSINSGGPLIDLSGRAVGVNVIENRENDVVNYVMPIDYIKKPLDDIININKIERLKLGVQYKENSSYFAYKEGIEKDYGIYITAVNKNSPASRAGIEENDLVYSINGVEINKNNNLVHLLRDYNVGDEIELKYIREGQEKEVSLELGE